MFKHLDSIRVSACALTTEGNEPKMPKGASKEKTALDVELATAVKLKSSILAALSKDHAVQDDHGWRCRLGRVHDVA